MQDEIRSSLDTVMRLLGRRGGARRSLRAATGLGRRPPGISAPQWRHSHRLYAAQRHCRSRLTNADSLGSQMGDERPTKAFAAGLGRARSYDSHGGVSCDCRARLRPAVGIPPRRNRILEALLAISLAGDIEPGGARIRPDDADDDRRGRIWLASV